MPPRMGASPRLRLWVREAVRLNSAREVLPESFVRFMDSLRGWLGGVGLPRLVMLTRTGVGVSWHIANKEKQYARSLALPSDVGRELDAPGPTYRGWGESRPPPPPPRAALPAA